MKWEEIKWEEIKWEEMQWVGLPGAEGVGIIVDTDSFRQIVVAGFVVF
jgi:hypothetical protein